MEKRARIGLIAGAMAVAVTGRGCVTTPPPVAESVVAGPSTPSGHSSSALAAGDAVAPDAQAPPAPPVPNPPTPSAPQDSTARPAQTPDERRSGLDKQLDDSLGAFDAKLHKEQQKTAEERDARQATVSSTIAAGADGSSGSGSAGAGTTGGTGATGAGATGAGASATSRSSAGASGSSTATGADGASATEVPGPHRGKRDETRNSRAGDLKSDKGIGGTASAGGNGALATIIADGNDDDIVARRLRKAAELETDPELKDKLWKEYVEYKKNTQVR
jgi:hypothetical protein